MSDLTVVSVLCQVLTVVVAAISAAYTATPTHTNARLTIVSWPSPKSGSTIRSLLRRRSPRFRLCCCARTLQMALLPY